MDKITHFEAYFNTGELPAPYAYTFRITAVLQKEQPDVTFEMTYTGREELEEEEIWAEGFTGDDDYRWEGPLAEAWGAELARLAGATRLEQKESVLDLRFTTGGAETAGSPANARAWEYFLQELVQAIYETGGKENPLAVTWMEIQGKEKQTVTLKASFASRSAAWHREEAQPAAMEWDKLGQTLKTIFAPEYLPEHASEKPPQKEGMYVNPGDGLWYKWGTGVVNSGKKSKELERLEALFRSAAKH